jgi:hypothetical protein
MAKRKGITPSLRWSVFSRDGFACRYCGAQAGQEGVELVVDHVVSVAEGGDNRVDNLVTTCRGCNGGKGARSLKDAPTSGEIVARIHERTATLQQQAAALSASIEARRSLEQLAVNLKCEAYDLDEVELATGETAHIAKLCQAYGADQVLEWYQIAASKRVPQHRAIKYVYGIVRNVRKEEEGDLDA